jgi:hypothetical protein
MNTHYVASVNGLIDAKEEIEQKKTATVLTPQDKLKLEILQDKYSFLQDSLDNTEEYYYTFNSKTKEL